MCFYRSLGIDITQPLLFFPLLVKPALKKGKLNRNRSNDIREYRNVSFIVQYPNLCADILVGLSYPTRISAQMSIRNNMMKIILYCLYSMKHSV